MICRVRTGGRSLTVPRSTSPRVESLTVTSCFVVASTNSAAIFLVMK